MIPPRILAQSEAKLTGSGKTALQESATQLLEFLNLYKSPNIIDIFKNEQSAKIQESGNKAVKANKDEIQAAMDVLLGLTTTGAPRNSDRQAAEQGQKPEETPEAVQQDKPEVETLKPDPYADLPLFTSGAPGDTTLTTTTVIRNSGAGLNFSNRGADYVAIFSNLIPSTELSLCVPYFKINFIQNLGTDVKGMPFLSLESFLGSTDSSYKAPGAHGVMPSSMMGQPIDVVGAREGSQISGMELFLTPQTVINPDINENFAHAALRDIRVLDPMQPLASIESINIDVAAVSQNFMATQSKIDMSIVLHDRSRLAEISPLVSPGIYPTMRAEIEWGWSHPDSNPFTTNAYAKFLNALRIRQVFAVSSTSIMSKDSTSLSIKIQLTGLGELTLKSTSIFTGRYVSYELIRAQVNQLINLREKKGKPNPDGSSSGGLIYVGADETPVKIDTWDTGDKWIKREDYYSILNAIKKSQDTGKVDELKASLKALLTNTQAWLTSTTPTQDVKTNMTEQLKQDLIEGISISKTFPAYYVPEGQSGKQSNFVTQYTSKSGKIKTIINNIAITTQEIAGSGAEASSDAGKNIAALGDLVHRLFTVPMGITRLYDEIRVFFFDFNDHAAQMSGFNIGAFPIDLTDINFTIISKNMSVYAALNKLLAYTSRPSAPAYGLQAAYLEADEAKKELATRKKADDEDTSAANTADTQARELIQKKFDAAVEKIYKERRDAGIKVAYENKFTVPRVKYFTEVTNVKDGDKIKSVFNIFIYDEANSGLRNINTLNAAITSRSGNITTVSPVDNAGLKITKIAEGKYTVSADRATAKAIITSSVPTIRIGSGGTTIINASYSSATSGDIANINILSGIKNQLGNTTVDTSSGIDADLFVIPGNLSITMLGMPLVNRGQTYYFDFGTGTTLDNVYTVTNVKHTIKNGQFTTSLSLNITGQGSIRTVTSMLTKDLDVISKYFESETPASIGPAPRNRPGSNTGNGRLPGRTDY